MDELDELCRRHALLLIEDACEALGAEYKGRRVGGFGTAAVFGFYPNKQMTMGEGGVITTNDDGWAAKLRSQRNQGRDHDGDMASARAPRYNYRLDEMSAALGLSQLMRIDKLLARRSEVATTYCKPPGRCSRPHGAVAAGHHLTPELVRVHHPPGGMDFPGLRYCASAGSRHPDATYFSPIHLQPYFMEKFGYREGDFPIAERVASGTLALPFHSNMSEAGIAHIVDHLRVAVASSPGRASLSRSA